MTEGNLWDVFIILNDGVYIYHTATSRNYDHFISFAEEHSWEIVAEELGLTNFETNKITGYSIKPAAREGEVPLEESIIDTGRHYLDELIALLNLRTDPCSDPKKTKKALAKLRENARHKL